MRQCIKCGIHKDIEEFRIRNKNTGLRRNECIDCIKIKHKKWRDSKPGINRLYYDKQYEKTRKRFCKLCGERYRTVGSSMEFCSWRCYIKGKVKVNDNECWEWQGPFQHTGYGKAKMNGTNMGAHKVSYLVFKGEVEGNLFVCHTCDNRKCVNPDHLYLGTAKQNSQDMIDRKRCYMQGQKFFRKYSWEEAKIIYEMRKSGMQFSEIARERNKINGSILNGSMCNHLAKKYSELLKSEEKVE